MSDEERLAAELASLRIAREPAKRSRSGGVPRWIVVVLILVALGGAGAVLFARTQAQLFPAEVEVGVVTLVSPATESVTLVATGYVYPRKRATVAPKVVGRIAKLNVDEGSLVAEGQLMAELEAHDPQAQLEQIRADVAAAEAKVVRARADLTDAEIKFRREDELSKRGAGTEASFDDARMRVTSAKAQLAAAESDVQAVKARHSAALVALDDRRIKAPFAGTVVRKLAELGEMVTPAGTGIFTVASLDDLEVQADVSESQLSKVKVGTPAEILLDAFPDRRFRAEVSEIRQTVDRAKASVTVKVRFKDDAGGVLPDMAAKVSFLSKPLDAAALKAAPKKVVPPDAIIDEGGRKVVLALAEGHVKSVPVSVGAMAGGMRELTSGPDSGTKIVRHPPSDLRDGAPVKEKK